MKGLLRHQFVFNFFQLCIKHYFKRKFNYDFQTVKPSYSSYIVLSNHTTNYDPIMVGLSFPKLLYYVASDHIFRWGFASRLIEYLAAPIPRLKAITEVQTIKQILRTLKSGGNICIFAEGNRSFSGETGDIPESTGKLVKLSGAALITYCLEGGYFTNPRWGRNLRRGSMFGRKVMEYGPEQIREMTVDQLNAAIQKDLYVNAYEEQKMRPVAYNGENLAEDLETALYLCPQCKRMTGLKSEGDQFYCSCGLKVLYTPYGSFLSQEAQSPPFQSVLDWSRWQSAEIIKMAEDFSQYPSDKLILSDMGQSLWRIKKARKSKLLCRGTLELYNNRLIMRNADGGEYSFDFDKISGMAIYSRMVLIFSTTDRYSYEIKSSNPRSAIKYLELFKTLKTIKKRE
ncbi:MAG TPA: hypothetical protein DD738_11555 [Ruminiclostridium sp.]|nr:hypothetical protein [Ruminiclostridium sp.]